MVIGAVLGAVLGAGAAYLLVQRAEGEDGKVNVSAGDGLKIGATVIALLRQVAALGDGQQSILLGTSQNRLSVFVV